MLYWRDESAQLSFGGKLLSISPDSLWYSHEKNPAIFRWSYQIPSFHTKPRHDVDIRVQNLVFPGEKPQHFTLMAFPRIPLARRSPRLAQARQEEHLATARVFKVQHQTSATVQLGEKFLSFPSDFDGEDATFINVNRNPGTKPDGGLMVGFIIMYTHVMWVKQFHKPSPNHHLLCVVWTMCCNMG